MTCDCKEKPCGCNNCSDDEEITQLTPLQSEECGCSPCGGCNSCGTKSGCNCNIVSDSECLTVDTSECGTIHLSVECPPIVTAGDNIRVEEIPCSEGEGCSIEYKVHSLCNDEKVKVKPCGEADYLVNLVKAGNGISITSDCNSLYINNECCKDDPSEKILEVNNSSTVINTSVYEEGNKHVLNITDKDNKPYYAKLVLAKNYIVEAPAHQVGRWDEYIGQKGRDREWKPIVDSYTQSDVRNSFCKNLNCIMPQGYIQITKKGLYHVGFTGSAEFSYGVHAFRVQLYRVPSSDLNKHNTIVESRYSGPLGRQPCDEQINKAGVINYVDNVTVSGGGESSASASVSRKEYKIDYPLIGEKTEAEGQAGIGYSASMGAILDRVPVNGNTIVELDNNDLLYVGIKVSTSITHNNGTMLHNVPESFLTGHLALLGSDVEDGDNGGECGFSFFADLIHPLN